MKRFRLTQRARVVSIAMLVLAVGLGGSQGSCGGATFESARLPPESDPPHCDLLTSQYVGIDLFALYPGGLDLSHVRHRCFENVQVTVDPMTGDETKTFTVKKEGTVDDGKARKKVKLEGVVTKVVLGRDGAQTGIWDTEILSMQLTGEAGGVPIEIRESPSLPSPGQTEVTAEATGKFRIDSFFDVLTELSVDGGAFQPQENAAGRLTLEEIRPSVTLPSPGLPPESDPPHCDHIRSHFIGINLQALFPNGAELSDTSFECFENVQVSVDPTTGDETKMFDARKNGIFDDGQGTKNGPKKVELKGPVKKLVRAKGGTQTGRWQTEILSMDLSGDVGGIPIQIRESPSLPSPGETTIVPAQAGSFQVDSFFDVFTELSVDGGAFQAQVNGSGRMTLEAIRPTLMLPSPDLPPEANPVDCNELRSHFIGINLQALFPDGTELSNTSLECFENAQVSVDSTTGDETKMFDAKKKGTLVEGSVPQKLTLGSGPMKVELKGPVKKLVRARGSAQTGRWQTEILSMDLSGDVGGIAIQLRESPSLPSPGATSVAPAEGGSFRVDSFFDVFTELSVDGGAFQPQVGGPGRMTFEEIRPSVLLPSPGLPPEADPADCDQLRTRYLGIDLSALFPDGTELSDTSLECFENVQLSVDPATGDETKMFDARKKGTLIEGKAPKKLTLGSGPMKFKLKGPVKKLVRAKGATPTGRWDTEIISMALTGDVGGVPIDIRESPNLPSPGETTVVLAPDGNFQVDSFFDVFIELSIDGEPFQPAVAGPKLFGLPEPGTLLGLTAGSLMLSLMARRRSRQRR